MTSSRQCRLFSTCQCCRTLRAINPASGAGDEKPPPDGDLAGDQIEGFALAEGQAGEAAPLAAAGETSDVSGDPTAPGFEASVAFFSLLQIRGTAGGEGFEEGVDFGFGFGLVAFEVEDIISALGVDITGEAVLAVGGIATEDDAFELEVAQQEFALGAFATGFGNAALGEAEAVFDAPQIDRGGHLQGSGLAPAAAPELFPIAGYLPQGRGGGPGSGRRGGDGLKLAHPVAHGPFEGVRIEQGKDPGEGIVTGRDAFEGDDGAKPRGFIPGEIGHVLEGIAAGEQAAEGDEEQIGEGVLRAALVAGIGNQPQRMIQQGRWREGQRVGQIREIVHRTDTPAPAFSSKFPAFVKSWKIPSWKTRFAWPLIA